MSASNSRLEDNRENMSVIIEAGAFSLLPRIGPTPWTVYTCLLHHAARSPHVMPTTRTIADECGISEPEAASALETLLQYDLIERDSGTPENAETVIYRILPVSRALQQQPEASEAAAPAIEPEQPVAAADNVLESDDTEAWKRRIESKRRARQLFASFVAALGDEDREITDEERARISAAAEIVDQAGATPEQVRTIAERIRLLQPRAAVDPTWIAEHWVELTRDLFNDDQLIE